MPGFPKNRSKLIGAGFVAVAVFTWVSTRHIDSLVPAPSAETPPQERAPASNPLISADDAQAICESAYRTVCRKTGETRDPTGGVRPDIDGEILALRTYEDIIRRHPDWSSEQVDEALVQEIYTPKRRTRLEGAYRWVLLTMERFIDRQPETIFTGKEKKLLKERLRRTELQLPPPAAIYADEPDLFTKNDVFYERTYDGKLRMRVGGAFMLSSKSWFNLVFTMAHEFAHSIDPCELRNERIFMPAYDRLTACFLSNELIATRKTRSECGENDQLSETFADWFAVRVSAVALKSFSQEYKRDQLVSAAINSVRDLCEQDGSSEIDLEFHPSPEIRIERIFGRNPSIRQILGCAPTQTGPDYCDFDFIPPPSKSENL